MDNIPDAGDIPFDELPGMERDDPPSEDSDALDNGDPSTRSSEPGNFPSEPVMDQPSTHTDLQRSATKYNEGIGSYSIEWAKTLPIDPEHSEDLGLQLAERDDRLLQKDDDLYWMNTHAALGRQKVLVAVAGAAASLAAVIAILAVIMSGSDDPPPSPAAAVQQVVVEAPAQVVVEAPAQDAEPSAGTEETDLEPISLTELFDIPAWMQLDAIGVYVSGKDGQQIEQSSDGPIEAAANIKGTGFERNNPYVFTMLVEGDGESLSMSEEGFYEISFVVNNEWPDNSFYDDTGFRVFVEWNKQSKKYFVKASLLNTTDAMELGPGTAVEWIDSSTLQVALDLPDHDIDVIEVRTEVFAYLVDDSGIFVYRHNDVAIWTAKP